MPVNIALIVVGSITSACALGCIISHECNRRRNGLTRDGRKFSLKGKKDIMQQYQAREALRSERQKCMHDGSWPIRNPASMRIRNPGSVMITPSVACSMHSRRSHAGSVLTSNGVGVE